MFNLNWLFLRDLLKSYIYLPLFVVVVQSLSHVQLFAIPWTGAHQTSLLFTISQSMLEVRSRDSVMTSNDLHLCHPLLLSSFFLNNRVFSSGLALLIRCQNIGVSASASVLPMNIQGWFSLGLAGLISLLFKGLSRIFSSTTIQKHQFFCTQSLGSNSHLCMTTGNVIALTYGLLLVKWCFCFYTLFGFVIAFFQEASIF